MASFNKVTLPIGVEQRSDVNMSAIHVGTTDFGRMDVVYHTELIRGDNVTEETELQKAHRWAAKEHT